MVVVRKESGCYKYLLLRAYEHWDFPKGLVEEGETPIDAARREVCEESTITELDFHWGYKFIETGPYGKGKVARYYIAETSQSEVDLPINEEIGKPEHEEFRWVTFDEAKSMVKPRVFNVLTWANKFILGKSTTQ